MTGGQASNHKFNMKNFKNKKFMKKPKGRYHEGGDDPSKTTFEDSKPHDVDASYGKESEDYSPGFQKKAFRDLAFGQVTTKINPSADAGYMADPYAIIGPTNPVIDAKYVGDDNDNGNVCAQLALGSESNFKNVTDFITEEVYINYNCCKHTADDNASSEVNKSYYYPWADIDSSIQAEAFYDLPFFGWVVTGTTYYEDPLLDIVDFYQTVLQAVYQIPLRYKLLRSMEKELKDMCYQHGDDILNDAYGRLKKAVLINTINGLSDAVSTHFIDKKWLEEVSMLLAAPCKKAVGMLDPLLEVTVKYKYNNTLVVSNQQGQLFTTASQDYTDLFNAINRVLDNLTMKKALQLARNNATYAQLQTWANEIADDVLTIKNKLKGFTSNFADFNVAFKRMYRAGYTNWEIGQFLLVNNIDEKYKPRFNKMVFDIIRTTFTGASKITYDARINQWISYSIWDKYLGLPSYDEKSGGSVFTFSTKEVVLPSGVTRVYPAMFKFSKCEGMTRQGQIISINLESIRVDSGAVGRVLGRLIPLTSLSDVKFNCPSVDLTAYSQAPAEQAWIIEALQHVFGYCKATVASNTVNYCISDDILTSVDFIVDDLTNAVDTQGRLNAPFKVLKATKEKVLGFAR